MRKLGIATAVGALLAGTAAQAQISIGATGTVSGETLVGDASLTYPAGGVAPQPIPIADGYRLRVSETHINDAVPQNAMGSQVESIVEIKSTTIAFDSGVAVSGPNSYARSVSGVDVTVYNDSYDVLTLGQFASTITPAGLGFYLQDREWDSDEESVGTAFGNNILKGYGQTTEFLEFEDLVPYLTQTGPFARADFLFTISYLDTTLYKLEGFLELSYIDGQIVRTNGLDDFNYFGIGTPKDVLDPQEAFKTPFAYSAAWNSTDIVVNFGEGGISIAGFDSITLKYTADVSATTYANCITPSTCLVAYSGFGDPIGRGGAADFDALDISGPSIAPNCAVDDEICRIEFNGQHFQPFRLIPGGGAVPEPATWAMMIMGFGMLGATLRRRRLAYARI